MRSFDRIADRYDATRGGEERGRRIATDLEPLFAGRGPTIEIGIGTGLVAQGLNDLGRPVTGIDIAPLMLRYARDRIGRRVAAGDGTCLPVRSGCIENAYSVWLLHLVDVAALMAEVARVLTPGGRYLVSPVAIPSRDPIQDIVGPLYDALGFGGGPRGDEPEAITGHANAAGLTLVGDEAATEYRYRQNPEEVAQSIERRDGAAFWDLDDRSWDRYVVPAIRALRALPDPGREIERVQLPRILVFRN